MVKIELSSLTPGIVSEHEYYSETGDLLIARGVLLNERHLEMLRRRNILELYIQGSDEERIVHEVLSTDYSKHHTGLPADLDREVHVPDQPSALPQKHFSKPKAIELPEFAAILPGESGFKQLSESKRAIELDKQLGEGRCKDQPVIGVKIKLRQITAKERSDEYKKLTAGLYNDMLKGTKNVLDTLASAKRLDYTAARTIVDQAFKIMKNDMAFLVNLVAFQYQDSEQLYHHSLNVSVYALAIAIASGYNQNQAMEIGIGGLLHDIGMLLVPQNICEKKGKLDRDEWYEVMKHPVLGVHLLEKIDHLPEGILFMAYQCHERENGKGYPKQRSSRFIHNYAKICAIADMYEALSSKRPYRDPYIPYRALELVIKASRQGLVSAEFTKSLVQVLSLFPVGSIVELNNKCVAKVVRSVVGSPSKPTVCLLADENGNALPGNSSCEIDLAVSPSSAIVKAHPSGYKDIGWLSGF